MVVLLYHTADECLLRLRKRSGIAFRYFQGSKEYMNALFQLSGTQEYKMSNAKQPSRFSRWPLTASVVNTDSGYGYDRHMRITATCFKHRNCSACLQKKLTTGKRFQILNNQQSISVVNNHLRLLNPKNLGWPTWIGLSRAPPHNTIVTQIRYWHPRSISKIHNKIPNLGLLFWGQDVNILPPSCLYHKLKKIS